IIDTARDSGLACEAGAERDLHPDEALRKIDAWLCDLKNLAIKDGLHVYGRIFAETTDPQWQASADAEREALITALDGKRVAPGPAGSPQRGRRDVVPTGRNLFTADPRLLPTPTAMEVGRLAAGEVIAQGLALIGCRPVWDGATGRVTRIEVLPCAAMGRPRVDVTWRISGLFRDLFPAQIALLDAATRLVAEREEDGDENPLAAAVRVARGGRLDRIFGNAPGAYGAGAEDLLGCDTDEADIGAAYLAATSHAYGGAEGEGRPDVGFAKQVASADLLLHPSNDPTRDLLEGAEDVAHIGGFAAAA